MASSPAHPAPGQSAHTQPIRENGQTAGEAAEHEILNRFRFECPACRREILQYAETCPSCGVSLLNVFSATYQPPKSLAARILAAAILILFLACLLAVFWMSLPKS